MSDNIFTESDCRKAAADNLNQKLPRADMSYAAVLVVDDIIPNLDVARGMLKPYRLNVDCVTSAMEAVERIREERVHYSAIFMDHIMPGIDGMEAVKIIREQINTEYAKNIPIIALAANAFADGDTLFLANGFQAVLSKPIDILKLDQILNHWVRDKKKEELPSAAGEKSRTGIFTGARIAGLKIAEGILRFGNDEEVYLRVLQSYCSHAPDLVNVIKTFSGSSGGEELASYRIAVHSLKGSSKGIGAEKVGKMAEGLESAALRADTAYVADNNGLFIEAVEQLLTSIGIFLKTVPGGE